MDNKEKARFDALERLVLELAKCPRCKGSGFILLRPGEGYTCPERCNLGYQNRIYELINELKALGVEEPEEDE